MCGTDTGLCSFVFDCLDATCMTPYGAAECVEDSANECWDGVNNDQDANGIDYCDSPDCECSSGDRLGCSFCATCEVNTQVGGTSSAIRYWITSNSGDDSGTCTYNWNDGAGTDSGDCDRSAETHVFASAGTHTVTVRSGADTISCPAVEIKNTCPSAVHGGGYAGCAASAPNTHIDPLFYCSTGTTCNACDAGTVWSTTELECVPPCAGIADGCTLSLTADENRVDGFCASSSAYCVDCAGTYGFSDTYSDCIPNCPNQINTNQAGCHASLASAYGLPASQYYCSSGTCYQCNAAHQWSGSSCDLICQADVCGDQSKCGDQASCELYSQCWWDGSYCCPDGKVYDAINTFACVDPPDPCYNVPDADCNSAPFQSSWWGFILNNQGCIDSSESCCAVNRYGEDTYYPITHTDIVN